MSERATWTSPDNTVRVTYPMDLFHEIDYEATDGYRRIPRGGIEIGGVLFGRIEAGEIQVAAKRTIDCEHAFGPSFKLSDRDLAGVKALLAASRTDSELSGLEPVGWFVAHTRSELVLTDLEVAQFNELFPGPFRLTALVKPEKFKPTRFTFLVRNANGEMPVDGTGTAFILPLPGRAGKAFASAPIEKVAPQATATPRPPEPEVVVPLVGSTPIAPEQPLPAAPVPVPEPRVAAPVPLTESPAPVQIERPRFDAPTPPSTPPTTDFASLPPSKATLNTRPRAANRKRGLILVLAVLLGGAAGCALYWALPAPIIDVNIGLQGNQYVVSWPEDQTHGAESVSMRINDGPPSPIPPADAAAARTAIPATDARVLKIEIIAHRRLGKSRGIAEFVK